MFESKDLNHPISKLCKKYAKNMQKKFKKLLKKYAKIANFLQNHDIQKISKIKT